MMKLKVALLLLGLFLIAQLLQVVYQRWQWGDNHLFCHLNTPLQVQTNITNDLLLKLHKK